MIFQYHILYRKLGCCWRKKKKKTQENDGGSRLISSRHYINYNKQTHQKKGSKELVSLSLFFFFFFQILCAGKDELVIWKLAKISMSTETLKNPFFLFFFFFFGQTSRIYVASHKRELQADTCCCVQRHHLRFTII